MTEATAVAGPFALLERDEELAVLDALLDAARCGVGRVCVIEGAGGIGKTRLLETLRYSAESRDVQVLSARGAELEKGFSFGVVRQLFEPLAAHGSHELMHGAARFARPLLTEPDPRASRRPEAPFTRLHGLYWLTASQCERAPLALLIDDAHWCDEPSLRFVSYLQRRLADLPVLLVLAARPREHRTDGGRLTEIAADPCAMTLRLRPLSGEACATMLREAWGDGVDENFVDACHAATGGNPFLLTELIAELRRQGLSPTAADAQRVAHARPPSVTRVLRLRLARLPAAAVKLAQAIAVLGEGAELRHAAALAKLPAATAQELAVVLADADLIAPERTLRFAHPLVRASVYAELAPWMASEMHRRAAQLLAESASSIDRVASHLLVAEPAGDPWTVAMLRRAALDAAGRGAPETAAAYLTRALAEPVAEADRAEVLLELGRAQVRAGRANGVVRLHEAFALARGTQAIAEAARELAEALTLIGNPSEAFTVMTRAIEQVAPHDHDLALGLEAQLGVHASTDPSVAALATQRLDDLGEIAGDGPGAQSARIVRSVHRARIARSAQEAWGLLEDALREPGLESQESQELDAARNLLLISLLSVDHFETLDARLERARVDAGAHGSVLQLGVICTWDAFLAFRRGDVASAEEDARRAVELLAADGWREIQAFAVGILVEAKIERGGLDEAEQRLALAGAAGTLPAGTGEEVLLAARARLRLALGRPAEALADLQELAAREHAAGAQNPLVRRHRAVAALALAAVGDCAGARAMAAEELQLARRWGAPRDVGIALRAAALVEAGEKRLALLREAVSALEGSPAQLELARALLDLGAALRRGNHRSQARAPLRQALDLAHRCRAVALADQARDELAATGARPRTLVLTGVESLTASERRVAQLAARALSNPEIAQALFVTRKTVEKHLSNVYTKLGVRSREELPAALEQ